MLSIHVKFVQTDRRIDNGKTICPPIFRYGGIKIPNFRKNDTFFPNLPGFGPVPKTMGKKRRKTITDR